MKKFTVFLLTVLFFTAVDAMDLLKDGKWAIRAVVIRPDASRSEIHAANELRNHLAKVAGISAPELLRDNGQLPDGSYIFLGNTASTQRAVTLPQDMVKSYGEIVVIGDDVYICGKDEAGNWQWDISQGTLFATYEFIEKFLGVRWLWPGDLGTYAPRKTDISVPEGKIVVRPRLAASRWRIPRSGNGWKSKDSEFRFRANWQLHLKRHRFSWDFAYQHGHAFTGFYAQYGQNHPEFFNLLPDGSRRPNPFGTTKGLPSLISMCPTSMPLAQEIVRLWAANPRRGRVINVNENDTNGMCVCDNCLAADNAAESPEVRRRAAAELFARGDTMWSAALGSVSDRYCLFYLNVQREAAKIDPQAIIFGLAYANYSAAPSGRIRLNDRIVLRYCPQIMYPWSDSAVEQFKREWKGWSDAGARLLFRPNFTSDGQAFPVQYHREYYEVFNFAAANGMIGSDLDSCTGNWASQALVNFIIAQINHDSTSSVETLENEFYQAFGPAKDLVREYFEYITQVTMRSGYKSPFKGDTIEGGVLFLDMLLVADGLFTEEVLNHCYSLLRRAQRVGGLSREESYRLVFLLAGLDNVKMMIEAQREFRRYQAGGDVAPFAQAVERLDRFRNSVEFLGGINIGYLQYLESRHWPSREMLKLYAREAEKLENWQIRFDPSEIGLRQNWQAVDADWSDAAAIGTDSHWEQQPFGQQWKAQHGQDFKGVGWYRTTFDVRDPSKPHEFVFIAVDGTATFYLNGRQIGMRPYPFEGNPHSWRDSFKVQIPAGLLKDKGNVLTVRIDKRIGLCGIWRPVFIAPVEQ